MAEHISEGERQVLNANLNMTNVIESADIRGIMVQTFEQIQTLLSDYCGPFSKYAVISDPLRPDKEPKFTKDGINIVRALEYMSPMQNFVKRTVAYIGKAIEHTAGDGTTSSMIIVSAALRTLIVEFNDRHYPFETLVQAYDRFVKLVEEEYKKHVRTVASVQEELGITEAEAIRLIARSQAYTSSHGDRAVAEAVAEMFAAVPPKGWGYLSFDRSDYETDERITVVKDDSQYSVRCRPFMPGMLNTNLGTEYYCENADLLVFNSDISTANPFMQSAVMQHVRAAIDEDRSLVVLVHDMSDGATDTMLYQLSKEYPNNKVAIFALPISNAHMNDLVCMGLCMGQTYNDTQSCSNLKLRSGVKASYKNGTLSLNNIYDNPNDSVVHPFVGNVKEHLDYNRVLDEVTRKIEQIEAKPEGPGAKQELISLRRMYNRMYLTRRVIVTIGGRAHDAAAAVDVIEDCLKACRASLQDGFVSGTNSTLAKVLGRFVTDSSYGELNKSYATALYTAIRAVHAALMKYAAIDNVDSVEWDEFFDIVECKPHTLNDIAEVPLVIQTATIDVHMLRRFGEVALKFINTTRVLTPGGVYVNKQGDEAQHDHR